MPLDELNNSDAVTSTSWTNIDLSLLGEVRRTPASFPLHILPECWRSWVEKSARSFTPVDYVAQALLSGVAGVCGAGVRVHVTSQWQEPLILWQALVGGPSTGKSAAFGRVKRLLEAVEPHAEGGDRSAPAILAGASIERLANELYGSSRGVMVWRDDLADWMSAARRRDVRPAWLAAWSASDATIGASRQVKCLPVSIVGTLQPDRLAQGFLDGDAGLAARFLYVWPETDIDGALCDDAPDDQSVHAMLQTIANFAGHPDTPGRTSLTSDSVAMLERFIQDLRRRMTAAEGLEAEWIGRGISAIVRIAGLLAFMEWAQDAASEWPPVEPVHLEAAHALWVQYYHPQARSVFDGGGAGAAEFAARRAARWLRRVRPTRVSREDIRRQALCQSVNAEGAEEVIARLESGGLLRPLPVNGSSGGGPRIRRWIVRPDFT